jgi:DNA-directed RNA polymerase subunit RPC12/RpoP
MGFTVEQECPQCGATIELDETDHLLLCPYCNVKNFLFPTDYFRFVLPNRAPDKELIYAPYLRFKGNVFYCQGRTVGHRVVDITHVGLKFNGIPLSLGLRPQAMKLKFLEPGTAGSSLLRFSLKVSDILTKAGRIPSSSSGEVFHRAFIGETLSLIYLPLFLEGNRLFDAVLNRPIAEIPEGEDTITQAKIKNPRWKLHFIATLCPHCGWNLEGERDSVVLTCNNCQTAWAVSKGRFEQVNFMVVPGSGRDTVYLPFWKTSAVAEGIEINSFADFIRITNQPRVVGKEWESEPMSFWSPAFKIRPKLFLHLSRQFTVTQKSFQGENEIQNRKLYPVTLPHTEAIQAMKMILAGSTFNKKDVLPLLPRVNFRISDSTLVYLPYTDTGKELIQQGMQTSINKNTLEFGRRL